MLTMNPNDAPALQFANSVGDRLADRLDRGAIPIVGLKEGAFEEYGAITIVSGQPVIPMGTGTLFKIGGSRFFITAAHVFDAESCQPLIGERFRKCKNLALGPGV